MNRNMAALTTAAALATGHLHARFREGIGGAAPAHVALDVGPGIASDAIALGPVFEQASRGGRELLRLVREHDGLAIPDGKPFDADAGRHHGLAHGHGLIGLDPGAPSDAERDDEDRPACDVGTDVFDPTENVNLGMEPGALEQSCGRVPAYHRDLD